MKGKDLLKGTAWFLLILAILAIFTENNVTSYFYIVAISLYTLALLKGKFTSLLPIVLVSVIALITRIFAYDSAYDLIDIIAWSLMLYGSYLYNLQEQK